MYRQKVNILKNKKLTDDIYDLTFKSLEISSAARPGQFINLYCADGAHLLPRPISICEINDENIRIVYRVVGKGTKEFSGLKEGDSLYVLGPVGNGYDTEHILSSGKSIALFGGGVGIPPMIELAKSLDTKLDVFLGYRDTLFLNEDFPPNADVYIATEDGSCGTKGNVLDALTASGIAPDIICACGPLPMLKALKKYATENNIKAYFSLEERMACGVGACLGCVCKTKNKDSHSMVNNARVCVDGPVFDAYEVEL